MKLAIIGSSRIAWEISKYAHEMDVETYCFSNVVEPFINEYVDHFVDISIFEMDRIVSICKENQVNGVIASTELTVSVAAYIAEKIGAPGLDYIISKEITNKYRNRQLTKSVEEISQPAFYEIDTIEELAKVTCGYPVIVKPTAKGGKRGITVVNSPKELLNAFKFAKGFSGDLPVIVEEFISGGKEYSVESLSYKGQHYIIQITEKITSGPPHCVELGHHQPAALSEELRDRVEQALKKGLSAIGVDNSTCHTEIKIVDDKIYLIEFNARPGGDCIAYPLTHLSTGYPYLQGAIEVALGSFKGVDTSKFEKHYVGVYFVTEQTARLKPVFDECEKFDWLYKKNFVSDELQQLEHNDSYNTNYILYYSNEKRIEL